MMDLTLVRFGTSSWAYEGWHGQVYHHAYSAGPIFQR